MDLHLANFDVHRDFRGVMTAILNVSDQSMISMNCCALWSMTPR